MKFIKTTITYSVEVTIDEFAHITKVCDNARLWEDTLCAKLDKIEGIDDSDFNGHFGAFIFFRVEIEFDTKETRNQVRELIKKYSKLPIDTFA